MGRRRTPLLEGWRAASHPWLTPVDNVFSPRAGYSTRQNQTCRFQKAQKQTLTRPGPKARRHLLRLLLALLVLPVLLPNCVSTTTTTTSTTTTTTTTYDLLRLLQLLLTITTTTTCDNYYDFGSKIVVPLDNRWLEFG